MRLIRKAKLRQKICHNQVILIHATVTNNMICRIFIINVYNMISQSLNWIRWKVTQSVKNLREIQAQEWLSSLTLILPDSQFFMGMQESCTFYNFHFRRWDSDDGKALQVFPGHVQYSIHCIPLKTLAAQYTEHNTGKMMLSIDAEMTVSCTHHMYQCMSCVLQ